jgi:N-methylhydantoinase B
MATDHPSDPSDDDLSTDPITFTVLWDRLVSICEEMGITLQRTGKSEAVSAGQDFSTALFDRGGRLIAQGNFSPGHLGSMPQAVDHVLDRFSLADLAPGDGVVLNDPQMGSGHLPDFFLISPIHVEGRIEGFAVTVAHQIDVGGLAAGSQSVEATDLYQEGLRLFPTKAIEGEEIQPWFLDLLAANVRIPDKVEGDFRAQQNANHRGARLFVELFEEYGAGTAQNAFDDILDRSEARVRSAIDAMPDGEYSDADQLDNVGVDTDSVRVHVTVTIDEDSMTFDYSGSDQATDRAINSYINYTRAYTMFVFKAVTQKYLHQNEGVLRPLEVVAPPGNFFNPQPPTPAGARPIVNTRIVDVTMGALSQAIPERTVAASSHWANPNFGGIDPETGEQFIVYDAIVGGLGASADRDGTEGIASSFNLTNIPVEIHETRYPILVEALKLIPNSGGPGRHRGSLGLRKDFRLLVDDVELTNLMERTESRPWGLFGGEPGQRGRTYLHSDGERRELHSKGTYTLSQDDTVSFRVSGSGGYGEPFERDPAAVLRDVRKGFVTPEHAREAYGVVVTESDGQWTVDETATAARREDGE